MTDLHDLNPDFIRANRDRLIAAGADPKLLPRTAEDLSVVQVKQEKELQRLVEDWLHHRGYWRRTRSWILHGDGPPKGWQIHLHATKRNPLMLDVLILANTGEWCEIELKAPGGRYSSKEQEELCTRHGHPCFDQFIDVVDYVSEWEALPVLEPVTSKVKELEI